MDRSQARKYILDPLIAPEPSQETGPGASHYNGLRGSLGGNLGRSNSTSSHNSRSNYPSHTRVSSREEAKPDSKTPITPHRRNYSCDYPSPPASASPSQRVFRSSNPFRESSLSPQLNTHNEQSTPPNSPPRNNGTSSQLPSRQIRPPQQRTAPHKRPSSVDFAENPLKEPEIGTGIQRSFSTRTYNPSNPYGQRSVLAERYPGDMSNRPLDVIKQEKRIADHRRHKPKQLSETDIIDSLDTIGGTYHHGGPYDATLISRNLYKKYSPVAAVEQSNREALKATPREYVLDSLRRHIPLQGTATIPNGAADMSGNVMRYAEGADLMREPDAAGGAYKRWEGIVSNGFRVSAH